MLAAFCGGSREVCPHGGVGVLPGSRPARKAVRLLAVRPAKEALVASSASLSSTAVGDHEAIRLAARRGFG